MEIISGKSRTTNHLLPRTSFTPIVRVRRRLDALRKTRCCIPSHGHGHDQTHCHMNTYAHCHAENLAHLFGLGMPRQHTVRCVI